MKMRKYLMMSVAVAALALGGCGPTKSEEATAVNDAASMENVTVPENDAGGSSSSSGGNSNDSAPGTSSSSSGGHSNSADANESAPAGTHASSSGDTKI
jgi:hypothetical protein